MTGELGVRGLPWNSLGPGQHLACLFSFKHTVAVTNQILNEVNPFSSPKFSTGARRKREELAGSHTVGDGAVLHRFERGSHGTFASTSYRYRPHAHLCQSTSPARASYGCHTSYRLTRTSED
ncbi:Uncharacterized protein TCM_004543 [Theobroma cacao]|uniref:Uncharacterized protein n=1 Tax=Theobroma cacao TaxID=3641 RepID=A0A061DQF0_THECC|nr:Uncharacterized protein TCM_004543 [Theobroma cacao]